MDENTLNDLLECSVCLERLDTTSKVLPCQHTFCRACLENIVAAHKALRCPECRILIDMKIDELPPNVLLMRILGGMKSASSGGSQPITNSTDATATKATVKPVDASTPLIDLSQPSDGQLPQLQPLSPVIHAQPQQLPPQQLQQYHPASQHPPVQNHQHYNGQLILQPNNVAHANRGHLQQPLVGSGQQTKPPTAAVVPQARALFDYVSKDQGDISFKKGDLILLRKRLDAHWYHGELNGAEGVFPVNHVQVVVPLPVPQCRALYDFRMGPTEEDGCLTFHKGAVITVLRRVDHNWAEGRIADCIGIFPIAFVEMNGLAKRMMEQMALSGGPTVQPTIGIVPQPPSMQAVVASAVTLSATSSLASSITTTSTTATTVTSVANVPRMLALSTSDSSSSSTLTNSTPSASSSPTTSSSSSSSTPTSPQQAASSAVALRHSLAHHNRAANEHKRHSLTAMSTPLGNGTASAVTNHSNRHSVEILSAPDPVPEASVQRLDATAVLSPSSNAHKQQLQQHNRRSHPVQSSESAGASRSKESTSSSQQRTRIVKSGAQSSQHQHPALPANYIALYPYKPHKSDELELKKGTVYHVTERCQDGWFKGTGGRANKSGVFPGNYVAPVRASSQRDRNQLLNLKQQANIIVHSASASGAGYQLPQRHEHLQSVSSPHHATMHQLSHRTGGNGGSSSSSSGHGVSIPPPELPPRSITVASNNDSVWTKPLGQHVESFFNRKSTSKTDNSKEKTTSSPSSSSSTTNGTISLMKRLTSIKRSKSPPPLPASAYSMDNPVFEDASGEATAAAAAAVAAASTAAAAAIQPPITGQAKQQQRSAQLAHPVHVRSGSCPSQLLQNLSLDGTPNAFGSQRLKGHKERPILHGMRPESQVTRSTPTRHHPQNGSQQTPNKEYSTHQQQQQLHHQHPSRFSNSHLTSSHATAAAHTSYHRKSHSLDATTIASQLATPKHNSGSSAKPSSSAQNAPSERFRCIMPYPPNSEFELELHLHDIVLVHKKRDNGWYKGTHGRTGRIGLFPASFVEPAV